MRYGYFTTGEFFPVELRRVSDFPIGFAEFDPGKDFGVVFVGAIEAPGRADFTVKGVLRREDGTPLDSFAEAKKYSEHADHELHDLPERLLHQPHASMAPRAPVISSSSATEQFLARLGCDREEFLRGHFGSGTYELYCDVWLHRHSA